LTPAATRRVQVASGGAAAGRTERLNRLEENRNGKSGCLQGSRPPMSVPAYGLKVVVRHVVGDVSAKLLRLHVGGAVMESCPDARLDELRDRLRVAAEGARRGIVRIKERGGARDLEAPLGRVDAEEHLQHASVCAVEAEMPGRVVGIRCGDECRPRWVGRSRWVAVLVCSRDRVPWPPGVRVVLVVPAVDRRVRSLNSGRPECGLSSTLVGGIGGAGNHLVETDWSVEVRQFPFAQLVQPQVSEIIGIEETLCRLGKQHLTAYGSGADV
jgi:hypothetical protein